MMPADGQSLLPHAFPVVVGSAIHKKEDAPPSIEGTALTLSEGVLSLKITNEEKSISFETDLKI